MGIVLYVRLLLDMGDGCQNDAFTAYKDIKGKLNIGISDVSLNSVVLSFVSLNSVGLSI